MQPSPTSAVPADTRSVSLEQQISRQAYALWEGYGRPAGRDVAIWLEAERQVLGVDAGVSQQRGGAVSAPALYATLTPQDPPASPPDGNASGPVPPRIR